ncbi:hypothetical protein MHI24_20155 [Paenibacillus sp. FSL K6-1096]|uniref:hypothetical protein n=1 Tax=Paenibacillus sp. FSL K6-1096 TaxID=2921460 RepID=UPI0030EF1A6D
MNSTLPKNYSYNNLDFWVDESIWGHRLYDEQTPWLCFMEFLGVLNSEYQNGSAFVEDTFNSLSYRPYSRIYLRNLLFNNPYIDVIYRDYENHKDEKKAWNEWILEAERKFAGIDSIPDFSYLKSNFDSNFEDFYESIKFLQSNTIEGENNKRWSSQFIFPYGKECLYEDLRIDGDKVQNDRRFFGRTGEVLYLMLSRSRRGENLLPFLETNILNSSSVFNRLAKKLQPDAGLENPVKELKGTYLPYEKLEDFENLADDWLNIFGCEIPAYDKLPHLVNMTGLHMILYFLNRSKAVLNQDEKAKFILEIMAPKKTVIRELASDSFVNNNNLSRQAIELHIYSLKDSIEWKKIFNCGDPIFEAKKILQEKFMWPSNDEDLTMYNSPDDLLNELVNKALFRHKQHVNNFHRVWGKEIGLSSSRNSQRIRYAPTDNFFKSLVITNVPKRMEFQDFLAKLYGKYGFIIGDKQAIDITASGQADLIAFSENALRLEQRLSSMGLVRRLSDAYAYVENPFAKEGY